MSFQDEIMTAVNDAMEDAMQTAADEWRRTPSLHSAAMLTETSSACTPDTAQGELVFEEHRQIIPVIRRDMYGVASKVLAAGIGPKHARKSTQTLMQKMEESLESGFVDSFDRSL